MRRRLTRPRVAGHRRWLYGLRLIDDHGIAGGPATVEFDLFRDDGAKVEGIRASLYRTTILARQMGERELLGYQTAASLAIREFERAEQES